MQILIELTLFWLKRLKFELCFLCLQIKLKWILFLTDLFVKFCFYLSVPLRKNDSLGRKGKKISCEDNFFDYMISDIIKRPMLPR